MIKLSRTALAAWLLLLYASLDVVRDVVNALRPGGWLGPAVTAAFLAALLIASALLLRLSDAPLRTMAALSVVALVYATIYSQMPRAEERMHLLEYGVVSLLAYASFPGRYRYARAMVFTVAAGWIDEGIQALLPSRMYDLRDVGFNALAGVLACGALFWVRKAGGLRT